MAAARKDSEEEAAAGGGAVGATAPAEVVEPPPEPTRIKNLYDSADIKHQLDSVAVEVRLPVSVLWQGGWMSVDRARAGFPRTNEGIAARVRARASGGRGGGAIKKRRRRRALTHHPPPKTPPPT